MFFGHYFSLMSQDSVVSIATGYGLDDQGVEFEFRWGQNFFLLHFVQTALGAHPASYPIIIGGSLPGVKRTGHEAGYSPPSSAEVKNSGAIPPLPHKPSWLSVLSQM
jgi:hypothetical protein